TGWARGDPGGVGGPAVEQADGKAAWRAGLERVETESVDVERAGASPLAAERWHRHASDRLYADGPRLKLSWTGGGSRKPPTAARSPRRAADRPPAAGGRGGAAARRPSTRARSPPRRRSAAPRGPWPGPRRWTAPGRAWP